MPQEAFAAAIIAACTIVWLTIMLPIFVFLFTTWKWRRDEIIRALSEEALRHYYKQFFPNFKPKGEATFCAAFEKDFDSRYGRYLYIFPTALLGAVSAAGLVMIGGTLMWMVKIAAPAAFHLELMALAALGGGFTWVVADQLGRFRNRDFTTFDVYNSVFRILVAVPLGYSLAQVAGIDSKISVSIAYLLGTFPTATLFTIARRLAGQKLNLSDDATPAGSELEQLPDLNKGFAERLKDEGISSITELAYADPVSLTIRTNKEFTYIVDCISQALLWMYITTGLPKVTILGLRGAQEVSNLASALEAKDDNAVKTLEAAAGILGVTKEGLRNTLDEVAGDPYTEFLCEIWDLDAPAPKIGKEVSAGS